MNMKMFLNGAGFVALSILGMLALVLAIWLITLPFELFHSGDYVLSALIGVLDFVIASIISGIYLNKKWGK